MRDLSDYMDDELHRRGLWEAELEKFQQDPYNREIAQTIVDSWAELEHVFRGWFGEDAELNDQVSLGDVDTFFNVTKGK